MPLSYPLDNESKATIENTNFNALKTLKLYGGLPVFTATPTYTGFEGEMVWLNDSTYYSLYAYINKGWRQIGTTDTTVATHKASHQNGGADEINVGGLSGELADNQPVKAHKTDHQNGGDDEISVTGLSGALADTQTPSAHKTSHENGGTDEIDATGLDGAGGAWTYDGRSAFTSTANTYNIVNTNTYNTVMIVFEFRPTADPANLTIRFNGITAAAYDFTLIGDNDVVSTQDATSITLQETTGGKISGVYYISGFFYNGSKNIHGSGGEGTHGLKSCFNGKLDGNNANLASFTLTASQEITGAVRVFGMTL